MPPIPWDQRVERDLGQAREHSDRQDRGRRPHPRDGEHAYGGQGGDHDVVRTGTVPAGGPPDRGPGEACGWAPDPGGGGAVRVEVGGERGPGPHGDPRRGSCWAGDGGEGEGHESGERAGGCVR